MIVHVAEYFGPEIDTYNVTGILPYGNPITGIDQNRDGSINISVHAGTEIEIRFGWLALDYFPEDLSAIAKIALSA